MRSLCDHYTGMRHTEVRLEEVDELLALAFYGDDEEIRHEEAVMVELDVDSGVENKNNKPGIIYNG